MVDIPVALRTALENGNCVLFLGAGMGNYYFTEDGNNIPNGYNLAKEMAEHFSIETEDYYLEKISQIVELRKGRQSMISFIKKRLSNITPSQDVDWISTVRWKAIYTTNYDNAIQISYDRTTNPKQDYKTISINTDYQDQFFSIYDVPIYHIHGALFNGITNSITVTQDDYTTYRERRSGLFELLKLDMSKYTFLYIGYSHRDSNWNMLMQEMKAQFDVGRIPNGYKIDPNISAVDIEIMKSKNVNIIKCTFEEFVNTAKIVIDQASTSREIALKENIPKALRKLQKVAPVTIVRLLLSWNYVNSCISKGQANTYDFLRGDKPNWALISSRTHFYRDVEEITYDEILDYATSLSIKPKTIGIFAPAGYGITTVLMSLAVKLVEDKAGLVFFLKDGKEIREGDIEFIANNSQESIFFFVDNIANNNTYYELEKVIQKLKDLKKQALFIVGSRLNEYSQLKTNINLSAHNIDPMSEGEIKRLVECLSKSKELGKLQDLTVEEQMSSIRHNYNREMLVAIREATEGKSFEAIISDEYHKITDQSSQKLYLAVCCFHQFVLNVRDSLLYKLIGMKYSMINKLLNEVLIGVVKIEDIDTEKGYYAMRARHSLIAKIVWETCSTDTERDLLILNIIDLLNITIKMDSVAFENFTKSDQFIDSIGTYEHRVDYFEKARKKDPENQYVKQHYARMLIRSNKYNLALDQISNAITEAEKQGFVSKMLYHTRGQALGELARHEKTISIARKYLAKAISEYEKAKSKDKKDVYSYQSIAKLYFDWSKRRDIENNESEMYVEKAEEEISDGLKAVRNKESLWILSSEIQNYFGHDDERINKLLIALKENPSKVITRYLLARAYRKNGDFPKAIDILKPVIKHHPEEFRVVIEYTKNILFKTGNLNRAISIMHISRIHGLGDARFVAVYGGMLALNGDEEGARDIFKNASTRIKDPQEIHKVHFRGICNDGSGNYMRIKGKVIEKNISYSLVIGKEPYPIYVLPSSKVGNIILENGMEIYFNPVFCAKGPRADNISLEK